MPRTLGKADGRMTVDSLPCRLFLARAKFSSKLEFIRRALGVPQAGKRAAQETVRLGISRSDGQRSPEFPGCALPVFLASQENAKIKVNLWVR